MREGSTVSYHLVFIVDVVTENPVGNYASFVDAHTGEILWRYNRVRNAEVRGRATGAVTSTLPLDLPTVKDFSEAYVSIGGANVLTDANGMFSRDISVATGVAAELRGPWADVTHYTRARAHFQATVNPGDSISLAWNDANSTFSERCAFYHGNLIHATLKAIDPAYAGNDFAMPLIVEDTRFAGSAAFCGVHIHLGTADAYWPPAAICPATIYHEYGHAINYNMYRQVNPACNLGMVHPATDEGTSDATAGLTCDRPELYQSNDGSFYYRTLENDYRYPDSMWGNAHHDGLVLGGSFWDLRKLTSRETALHLLHFARYGTPDDIDEGIAFSEWYVEVLLADDDNGNLADGTPHFPQINEAFNRHGIGSGLYTQYNYTHVPVADDPASGRLKPYPVSLTLSTVTPDGAQDSVLVHYSTDRFATSRVISATKAGDEFTAQIRGQQSGRVVSTTSASAIRFGFQGCPSAHAPARCYSFVVGAQSLHIQDFENLIGWGVLGSATGKWKSPRPGRLSGMGWWSSLVPTTLRQALAVV